MAFFLLHRTGVPNDLVDNMKAAEDFLLVVLHSHVIGPFSQVHLPVVLMNYPEA